MVPPSVNAGSVQVAAAVHVPPTDAAVFIVGVVNVGDVLNTRDPDPVSSVTADARFADVGLPRNVAMPVARPDTPVLIGKPEQFVNVPELGVPNAPPGET